MSTLTRTLLGRLGGLMLTLFLASVVIFSAVLLTGDPIAALAGGAKPTPELIAQIRRSTTSTIRCGRGTGCG